MPVLSASLSVAQSSRVQVEYDPCRKRERELKWSRWSKDMANHSVMAWPMATSMETPSFEDMSCARTKHPVHRKNWSCETESTVHGDMLNLVEGSDEAEVTIKLCLFNE
jgi:hypothetical protein